MFDEEDMIGSGSHGKIFIVDDTTVAKTAIDPENFDEYILKDLWVMHRFGKSPYISAVKKHGICDDAGMYIYCTRGEFDIWACSENYNIEWNQETAITETFQLLMDTAEGLRALHKNQVIHADVKPCNIIRSFDKRHFLTDFGICVIGYDGYENYPTVVTEGYRAPEVVDETTRLTPGIDIWALGITILKLAFPSNGYSDYTDYSDIKKLINYDTIRENLSDGVAQIRFDSLIEIIGFMLEHDAEKRISAYEILILCKKMFPHQLEPDFEMEADPVPSTVDVVWSEKMLEKFINYPVTNKIFLKKEIGLKMFNRLTECVSFHKISNYKLACVCICEIVSKLTQADIVFTHNDAKHTINELKQIEKILIQYI